MLLPTALGTLTQIRVYVPTKQDAPSIEAIVGAAAPELHLKAKRVAAKDWWRRAHMRWPTKPAKSA